MAILRIKNGVDRYPAEMLVSFSNTLVTNMTGNTHFPSPVPSLTNISTAASQLLTLISEAGNGDRIAIAAKNAKQKELVNLLHNLFNYILFTAAGDRDVVLTTGVPLVKSPEPVQITKPVNIKVVPGANKGTLVISVKGVKGAKAYIHQYTTDPNMAEDSWKDHTCTASKCLVEGLTSGTNYYCRVGAVGANDQVIFSDVIACIAL